MPTRRSFLKGFAVLLTAPAAVMSGRATAGEAFEAIQRQISIESHLAEKRLKAAIQKAWVAGQDTDFIYIEENGKQSLMEAAGTTLFHSRPNGEPGNIIVAVDVFVSDFGEHTILPFNDSRKLHSPQSALVQVEGVPFATLGVR